MRSCYNISFSHNTIPITKPSLQLSLSIAMLAGNNILIIMSKRVASAISLTEELTVPTQEEIDASSISTNGKPHYIEQTLVGPICTHPGCMSKVARCKGQFLVVADTILSHWKRKGCFTGNKHPNARQLAKDLKSQLISMHDRIKRNPSCGPELFHPL